MTGTSSHAPKHLLVQGKIEIPDDIELLRELRNLREKKTPRGQIDIRRTTGNDDTAVALALAVNEAITQESPLPFEVVPVSCRPTRAPLHLDPENCLYAAPCENHPNCLAVGYCLDFKSKSVSVLLTRISF